MNHSTERSDDVLHRSSRKQKSVVGSLPDYVRRLRHERNLSLAVVSARARGKIGKTHINRIENGLVSSISLTKLRALAVGLGVPDDEIIAVAQGKFPHAEAKADEARLLIYFRHLSRERQLDVLGCCGRWRTDLRNKSLGSVQQKCFPISSHIGLYRP